MNIKTRLEEIEKLQETLNPAPWEVRRTGIEPQIHGNQVCLTKWDGADYVSLEEARLATKWLAEQLGFVVTEPEKKKAKK